jgi:hypothetical protein
MVTLDQRREASTRRRRWHDALTGGRGDQVIVNGEHARHVVSYMKDFLFKPEQARTPVGALSGGERGRLMLARALAAVEPAGAGRADQRSRSRNARPAAGAAGRIIPARSCWSAMTATSSTASSPA